MKELGDIEKSIGENVGKLQKEIESKKQNQEENIEIKILLKINIFSNSSCFSNSSSGACCNSKNYVLAGIPLVLSIIDVIILAITQNKKEKGDSRTKK